MKSDSRRRPWAFHAALERFGAQGVMELSLIMGNYSLLVLLNNACETDLPPGRD
jgi:hypothetical protein